jgi:hypothetical protein
LCTRVALADEALTRRPQLRDVHFADTYDYAFARFGTMFIANPVAALVTCAGPCDPAGG